MATFVSAFDEAPKTPTRGTGSGRSRAVRKEVAPSPEAITPPKRTSNHHLSAANENHANAVPQKLQKSNSSASLASTVATQSVVGPKNEPQTHSTDKFQQDEDILDLDSVSVVSKMDFETASIKYDTRSIVSTKRLESIEEDELPEALLPGPETDEKLENLQSMVLALQSKIDALEAQRNVETTHVQPIVPVTQPQVTEKHIIRLIQVKRMESVVSAILPFLSAGATSAIATWLIDTIGFSTRTVMRRAWTAILMMYLSSRIVQARMPQAWTKMMAQHVPREWHSRFFMIQACVEVALAVQFSIAAFNSSILKRIFGLFFRSEPRQITM